MSDTTRTLNKLPFDYDMAMTTKIMNNIAPFSGYPGEDVYTWVTNTRFMIHLFQLPEDVATRIVCLNLKRDALDWFIHKLQAEPNTSTEDLLLSLEN
ncbi:hypothetical protein PAEPH01_2178 [Pancytospora epiphaga]|nr:hypothetical protein PAEPH01_2178 [Pancytospora epiphaga]